MQSIFEQFEDDGDLTDIGPPGQADAESAESMALWCCGLLEDPIDERDKRAADEAQYYGDIAFLARKFGSEGDPEFLSDDLEDLDER